LLGLSYLGAALLGHAVGSRLLLRITKKAAAPRLFTENLQEMPQNANLNFHRSALPQSTKVDIIHQVRGLERYLPCLDNALTTFIESMRILIRPSRKVIVPFVLSCETVE
jgi:hypothetical protein